MAFDAGTFDLGRQQGRTDADEAFWIYSAERSVVEAMRMSRRVGRDSRCTAPLHGPQGRRPGASRGAREGDRRKQPATAGAGGNAQLTAQIIGCAAVDVFKRLRAKSTETGDRWRALALGDLRCRCRGWRRRDVDAGGLV
jgi:hypothetical protein